MTRARILNVDDLESRLYVTSRYLRHAGFEVAEATTAADTRKALRNSIPDLVVLDVNLPDGNGVEICAEMRQNERLRRVPVLMLSASSVTGSDRALGLNSGADGYLVEPVEAEELVAAVEALLRMKSAETALRVSEAKYRTLLDAIPQLVWTAAPDGAVFSANARWKDYTGYSADRTEATSWLELVDPEQTREVAVGWDEAIAAGTTYEGRFRLRGADGTHRWFLARAVPQVGDDGQVVQWFGTFTDVDEQVRQENAVQEAERREREARELAERANLAKDEFFATLSHELRTPMTAIMGWASMLEMGLAEGETQELALRSLNEAARLQARLIDDLLDITRAASGKLLLDHEPVDLFAVVYSTVESLRLAAESRELSVVVHHETPVARVRGDQRRLHQIASNLLSNAIKFTPRGGRVDIRIFESEDEVVLRVRDTGKGIEPEFLPRVFEWFSQQDAGSNRQHDGLGLGLAIVRDLVALHGGRIEARSEGVGRGAEFTVHLPRLLSGATALG